MSVLIALCGDGTIERVTVGIDDAPVYVRLNGFTNRLAFDEDEEQTLDSDDVVSTVYRFPLHIGPTILTVVKQYE